MRRWEKNLLYKNCRFFPWKKTTKNLTSFFHGFFHGKNLKKIKRFFLKVSSFLSFINITSRRAVQNRNFDEICNEGRSRFFWTTLLRTHNHESHSISLRLTSKRHAIFCSAILSVCSNLSVGLVADTMKVVCTVMYLLLALSIISKPVAPEKFLSPLPTKIVTILVRRGDKNFSGASDFQA